MTLTNCCELLIEGHQLAPTAVALMRSRYTAFSLKNIDYIERTTHPNFRKDFNRATNLEWAKRAKFIRLEVLTSKESGNQGEVTFKAYYLMNFKPEIHIERSTFQKDGNTWYFCQGV